MIACSPAMATFAAVRTTALTRSLCSTLRYQSPRAVAQRIARRRFETNSKSRAVPDFAFAFDIDGVLLRSSTPIPKAAETLARLQDDGVPFILLTNGGGKSEEERVADLSSKLGLPLDTGMFVQSHTPFAELTDLYDKTILVVGGDGGKCADVARGYGFKNVVTPGDILVAHPDIWPFSQNFIEYYKSSARPLPRPIDHTSPDKSLKVDAIFVFNDPRDWGLDSTVIIDLLLSRQGTFGTLSKLNGDKTLPNSGYLQDGQPTIYYSNPDLWWASSHALPRLGQGGFREAFDGLWSAATNGAQLNKIVIGKPHYPTYEFAERRLRAHRKQLFGSQGLNDPLRQVYMIGDNTESDIRGANGYQSPFGSQWTSILVKTGVYQGGKPNVEPDHIANDVHDAVQWALKNSDWHT